MPPPRPPDDTGAASARLQALRPSVGGWIPDQPLDATEQPESRGVPDRTAELVDWRQRISVVASGRSLAWLLGAGAVVVAVGVYGVSHHHGGEAPPVPAALPAGATSTVAAAAPAAQIIVDVGGRVRHPGLVTLAPGARVADAIAAAGGAVNGADLTRLDLAARVSDGELLLIGVAGAGITGAGNGASGGAGTPVDLNAATVDQLDALPGVGPVLAQRIVSWRDAHGGFRSVDELQQVPGIGARKYADLKALVQL